MYQKALRILLLVTIKSQEWTTFMKEKKVCIWQILAMDFHFDVIDIDSKTEFDFIGDVETSIGEIFGARN